MRDPWVWGQAILGAAVVLGVPRLAQRLGGLDPAGPVRWLGVVLTALGAVVMVTGAATLGPNLTPATQPLPHGRLVTRGIYRVVRHPIYLGVTLVFTGYGALRGGWWAGAVVLAATLAYFERKARVEERWMEMREPAYRDYRARVPRILPGGWR